MFKRMRKVETATADQGQTTASAASATATEPQRPVATDEPATAPMPIPSQPTAAFVAGGVEVKSKVQAVIVDPDADLSRFRQLPDTDRSDPEFFAKNWKGEKTVVYALFMRQRFPFWKAIA